MVTVDEVNTFMKEAFPQSPITVEGIGNKSSQVRLKTSVNNLRPGGTVSGPSLFAVADSAIYVAIFGEIGFVSLAVTTNMNINFLNKPAANADILGECKIIKSGKRLVIAEVTLYSEGVEEPVAHAVGTYSIPPKQ